MGVLVYPAQNFRAITWPNMSALVAFSAVLSLESLPQQPVFQQ